MKSQLFQQREGARCSEAKAKVLSPLAFIGLFGGLSLLSIGCQFHTKSQSNLANQVPPPSESAQDLSESKANTAAFNQPPSSSPSESAASMNAPATQSNSTESNTPPTENPELVSETSSSNQPIKTKQSWAESFLFQPVKYPKGGYTRLIIEGQRVRFESEDGTELDGRFFRAVSPKGVILFCHGNAGNLVSRTPRMEELKKRYGYSIFLFDYRGYGRSLGKPTVSGVLADGRAAVREAAKHANVKPSEVIIMGRSLGGAVAVQLALEFQSPKLIIESSFTSFRDIAKHHVSFLSGFTRKDDLTSKIDIARYKGQVLISHGTADKVVPIEQGKRLYEAANQPKQFYEIKDGGHNDPPPEGYKEALGSFLRSAP